MTLVPVGRRCTSASPPQAASGCGGAALDSLVPALLHAGIARRAERSLAFIKKRLESSVTCAAHRQARAIAENRKTAVLAVRLDAHDAFQVHDVRAMDAHEAVRVEAASRPAMVCCLRCFFP